MAWLTRENFLTKGLEIIAERGSDGLTIASLCAALKVSKGSFYHHFDGLGDYIDALLNYWEEQHSQRLILVSEAEPEPIYQVPVLTEIALNLPHATEAALRAWGKSNPAVAATQARVDAARSSRILQVLLALDIPKEKAVMLTDLGVSLLIGFQHQTPQDVSRLKAMFDEVNRLIYLEASAD